MGRGMTQRKAALALLAWDTLGLGTAWGTALALGWSPTPWAHLVPLVAFVVAYVLGAFALPTRERPWMPTLAAAVPGLVMAVALIAVVTPQTRGWLPVAALALWPVCARMGVLSRVRAKLAAARWLLIGDAQVLLAMERERARRALDGRWTFVSIEANHGMADVLGLADLETLLCKRWSGIILGAPLSEPDVVRTLMLARLAGMPIHDLAEFWEDHLRKVPVLHLDAGWMLASGGFHLLHSPMRNRLKRLSDVVFAGGLLVLAWPLMVLTALAVRWTSPGPVLFRQVRVGVRGEPFTVLKFRSMRSDAEKEGAVWAQTGDARVTPIGGFIRKTRLDELPQLWNILRGDMSFIGPRPERPEFTGDLAKYIPFYHLRHIAKPGLTGWAQVNYPYGASVEDAIEKLQYDLWYLKHHSLLLDLRILLKTVRVVLFGMGR